MGWDLMVFESGKMVQGSDARVRVSVVMATYNGAATVQESIQSALAQSEPPCEIVVVDDASTDATAERIRGLGPGRVPIRLIRLGKNSGGPARPYNVGASVASGSLLAFLDQDDLWHPDKLSLSRLAFEGFAEASLVYADCESFEGKAPRTKAIPTDASTEPRLCPQVSAVAAAFRRQFTLTMSNMVLRKKNWEQLGGFPQNYRISTDYAFLARLLSRRVPVVHIPATLVFYRVSSASVWLSSDYLRRNLERYMTVDYLCRRFPHTAERDETSRKLGADLYDLADQAARRGKLGQALGFYAWSLLHYQAPTRVLRASVRTVLKGIATRLSSRKPCAV
jgi:teichuronic acid biosynthesis glycosyltransferase TuaG